MNYFLALLLFLLFFFDKSCYQFFYKNQIDVKTIDYVIFVWKVKSAAEQKKTKKIEGRDIQDKEK